MCQTAPWGGEIRALPDKVDYLLGTGRWEICPLESGLSPFTAALIGLTIVAVIFAAGAVSSWLDRRRARPAS